MRHEAVIAIPFSIGDLVTKRSGAMPFAAEVRGIFQSSKGKPLVALEYPGGIFRVARPQQLIKAKEYEREKD